MRRRDLIAAGGLIVGAAGVATAAAAAPSSDAAPAAQTLNLAPLGLPVITDGRLRNYVFVQLRLHLGSGRAPESLRPFDPFIRDALIRVAHRRPFPIDGDWTRLSEPVIVAAALAAARASAGAGAVTRVELVSQAPRRRTGMQGN